MSSSSTIVSSGLASSARAAARPWPAPAVALVAALVVWLVAAAAAAAPAAPAAAGRKPAAPSWVVLVHTAGDAPATWAGPVQRAVQAAAPERTWVPPPTTELDELQVALGCRAWDAACAGVIAASAGATHAFVVTLTANGRGVTVEADAVGADTERGTGTERLALATTTSGDLRTVERWLAAVVRGSRAAVVFVGSDLAGDEVLLDGVFVGRTPATIVDVPPGEHRLQVRRAGRAPAQRALTVAPGARLHETVTLGATTPATLTTSTVGVGSAAAAAPALPASTAWGVAGVGGAVTVVGAVLSVLFGLPILEASLNETPGRRLLDTSYRPLLSNDVVPGRDRNEFLAGRFFTTAEIVADREDFDVVVRRATTLGTLGIALVGVGGVLAVTGLGFGVTAEPEAPAKRPQVDGSTSSAPTKAPTGSETPPTKAPTGSVPTKAPTGSVPTNAPTGSTATGRTPPQP
jgi:hypothetical protein